MINNKIFATYIYLSILSKKKSHALIFVFIGIDKPSSDVNFALAVDVQMWYHRKKSKSFS